MPRPVYIICSHSGADDKYTGLLSHFDVVEKLLITKIDETSQLPQIGGRALFLRIVSVWMKNEEDSEDKEYEYETSLIFPPSNTKKQLNAGKFEFVRPLHRIVHLVNVIGGPPRIEAPGVMWVESKIRNLNQDTWISQAYPIFLDFLEVAPKK